VALVFAKPLDEPKLREAFDPEFVTALAARSPLGSPVVLGLLFRVADTLAAEQGFRRWGFQDVLTDKEVPPTLRRHLPTDRPADPMVSGGGSDAARAATSVAPPGMARTAVATVSGRDAARRRSCRRPRPLPRLPRHRPGDLQPRRQAARGDLPVVRGHGALHPRA
jgi:hypothetical protein